MSSKAHQHVYDDSDYDSSGETEEWQCKRCREWFAPSRLTTDYVCGDCALEIKELRRIRWATDHPNSDYESESESGSESESESE